MNGLDSFRPRTFKRIEKPRNRMMPTGAQSTAISFQSCIYTSLLCHLMAITLYCQTLDDDVHPFLLIYFWNWFGKTTRFTFQSPTITSAWVSIPLRQQTAVRYVNPVVIVVSSVTLSKNQSSNNTPKKKERKFRGVSRTFWHEKCPEWNRKLLSFCFFLSTMWKWSKIYRSSAGIYFYLIGPCCRVTDLILCENLII